MKLTIYTNIKKSTKPNWLKSKKVTVKKFKIDVKQVQHSLKEEAKQNINIKIKST